ncbi:MAG: HPr family phosphocarrier protein [Actinomycetaceae bacterium]|nr:HPr family phosphocarrier protein [Actinomycetaceae bacterium]
MPEKTVQVASEVGLHARPAAVIARKAAEFDSPVYITLRDETVEATSGLMIMTLGAQMGDEVVVSSEDPQAVEAVCTLVESAIKPF